MAEVKTGDNQAPARQFQIQRVYLKDVSVETPNTPAIFREQWQPEVNVQLGNAVQVLADGVHEVVTTVTVTAKIGEKTAYLVEVHQAGIFTISGFDQREFGAMVGSFCPNILFPFAREAISDLVTKAGFPQLLLAPVNFDAIYAQHQSQLDKNAEATQEVH